MDKLQQLKQDMDDAYDTWQAWKSRRDVISNSENEITYLKLRVRYFETLYHSIKDSQIIYYELEGVK